MVASVELGGIRTVVAVPMLRNDELVGVIAIYRQEVRPFNEKQIALLTNFAAQAVIAIENARLLNELRQRTADLSQRTADLTESLEQQTATSEVLQVISSSPGDLEPVFAAMLEKAVRICDAKFGNIYRRDGDGFQLVATHNAPPGYAEARRRLPQHGLNPESVVGRMAALKAVVHVADASLDLGYTEQRVPELVLAVELGGLRTGLAAPMLKENELIGALALCRQEVRPFTDKQIELVQNFAAQAVIAIENTRLLNELRESLQEQTATSEVLQVISSSPGNVQPVFATMLEKAVSICDATFGNIYRWDGDALHLVSSHNTPPTFAQARKRSPHRPPEQNADSLASVPGRMVTTKSTIHVADLAADQAYLERHPQTVAAVELGGVRTFLGVPMLKEGELIGAFALSRQEVRPFTDKQIELVKNFAAQAVIAIENARLLNELRQRTEEVEKLNQHLEQRVTDQVGEIERTGRLRRFLPPQVADLIVASGTEKQLESHRREITALFCDLRGFTGFSESSDPEDVMALLREYHAAIGEIIIKYSGTLERYAGDGVMVVFNDPVPVPKPALQAVRAALDMRAAIEVLTEKFSDLVGSTALAARMDPEDLREIISAYQKCVAETVGRFGGFVAKYLGDGVLIYFGYPHAHEDDAERAVRAGLELIAAVGALKAVSSLQTRVEIATGLVVVGDLIGTGSAQEQAVVGETPNLAARLQGIAEPNTVVIAEIRGGCWEACLSCRTLEPRNSKASPNPCALMRHYGRVRSRAASSTSSTILLGRRPLSRATVIADFTESIRTREGTTLPIGSLQ